MRDDSNKVTGVVASTRDITEKKLAENQLTQKEKLTAMGQMLAGAAHELNNPLTAILGVGDLLRERAVDDTTRRHAELILQQSRRAAAIVQNLVSFSRPFAPGLLLVRVDEVVRQCARAPAGAACCSKIFASNMTLRPIFPSWMEMPSFWPRHLKTSLPMPRKPFRPSVPPAC